MSTVDQELIQTILGEIDSHLREGVLPVHNGHLKELSVSPVRVAQYKARAKTIAQQRAALAGARLAKILNEELK